MTQITTDDRTIGADLQRSLVARRGVFAGRTWADFKRAIEGLGVTDSDEIESIEYGVIVTGTGLLTREDSDHGRVEIREKF